jgi:hypothetical protein
VTIRPSGSAVLGVWLLATLLVLGRALAAETAGTSAPPPIPVDMELVLAVDVSGSVDPPEYELQTRGLAAAFRDPEVQAALQAPGRHGIAVALIQWSGRFQQAEAIGWTLVRDAPSAEALARRLETMKRRFQAETGIANALAFAFRQLRQNPFAGGRQVIDISGDGPSNVGPPPDTVRDAAVAARITINGLAIVNEIPTLDLYYADHVIGGPDAFLLVAKDYEDFARAIRRKLLREIESTPIATRDLSGPLLARAGDERASIRAAR